MWTDRPRIRWVTLMQVFFDAYQWYFDFRYHQHSGQSKMFQHLLLTLLSLPLKSLNLTMWNIPTKYFLKIVFVENLLRLTLIVRFPIKNKKQNKNKKTMSTSKTWIFICFFRSISYNNVVVTKQVYFSSAFLKSWVYISDNIAGVVGGPQYY